MSYDLDLYFEPAVSRSRILEYFTTRKRYTVEENNAVYQNPDTGVYFFMRLRCARSILLQKNVVAVEFEINYQRPSFFGTEAENRAVGFCRGIPTADPGSANARHGRRTIFRRGVSERLEFRKRVWCPRRPVR
jgi:hypothetical protein